MNLHLDALKLDEDASDTAIQETAEDVAKLSELLKDVSGTYHFAHPLEKERIIRVIFSELIVSENTLEYKCRKGFQALASRFLPNHDPTGWLVELCHRRAVIRHSIHELELFLAPTGNDNEEPDELARAA